MHSLRGKVFTLLSHARSDDVLLGIWEIAVDAAPATPRTSRVSKAHVQWDWQAVRQDCRVRLQCRHSYCTFSPTATGLSPHPPISRLPALSPESKQLECDATLPVPQKVV